MVPAPLLWIEPALCHARAALKNGDATRARRALGAAYAVLDIHRPPRYESYEPLAIVRGLALDGVGVSHGSDEAACYGDPAQVAACVAALAASAVLFDDTALQLRPHQEGEIPCLAMTFDGPGKFGEDVLFGGMIALPFEVAGDRWTAATRGGRIGRTPDGLLLRLAGKRAVPESLLGLDDALVQLAAMLESLDAAVEPGAVLPAVEVLLTTIEQDARGPEPADIAALVKDVGTEAGPFLEKANLQLETLCCDDVPPVLMRRQELRVALGHVLRHGARTFSKGGGIALLVEYDRARRVVSMSVSFHGSGHIQGDTYCLDSPRRCVEERHGGTWDYREDAPGATLVFAIPDTVGRALDAWIPGWDGFSPHAQQMLRLLRSGGPTPPEDFILEGVLEDELARWLLPRYESPVVVNIVHDIKGASRALPGSSAERLDKALTQIRRGKPRKEIVRPSYAAEVIWALGDDEPHRRALGLERCTEGDLRSLCGALLRSPVDNLTALRLLATRILA